MKIAIKIFFSLLVGMTAFTQVNSVYEFVQITDTKAYLFKYKNDNGALYRLIQNGSITFTLENNQSQTDFYCGEIGCFFSNSSNTPIQDSGNLIIHYKQKRFNIPYRISFNKKRILNHLVSDTRKTSEIKTAFSKDISDTIQYKRIQNKALSCEISATADILSHLTGENITEDVLLPKLPKSQYNTLPSKIDGKTYWGNPQAGFVGYIHKATSGSKASQRKMTGYGVLEKPIEKVFNDYGFKTKAITQFNYSENFTQNEHLSYVLQEFEKGNMVQLWGDICTNPKYFNGLENPCTYNGKPSWDYKRELQWHYIDESGKERVHTALNGEHAFYLLGYKGGTKTPTDIIIWDTLTGKHTYPTSEWMRKWKKMQYRSIIVYAK